MRSTLRLLLALSALSATSAASATSVAAQTRVLLGRVTDSVTTKAIAGGDVKVMGTTLTAPLREDGSFALSIPLREVTLSIEVTGYRSKEVRLPVNQGEAVLDVQLARDYFNQEREVVTGQATGVDRKNVANNVGEVSGEDLSRGSTRRMDQALKGRVPGADVTVSSDPGAAMAIRLRGMSTLLGSTTPLYVVDGVIVYSIDGINPNDIEDIQLLKGASAGAMYGSRASNGVIIIKTKRGGGVRGPARR